MQTERGASQPRMPGSLAEDSGYGVQSTIVNPTFDIIIAVKNTELVLGSLLFSFNALASVLKGWATAWPLLSL